MASIRRNRAPSVRLLIPMHWDSVYCTDVILSFPHGLFWFSALSYYIYLQLLGFGFGVGFRFWEVASSRQLR